MGQPLAEMVTSKKFLMMVVGLIVWFAGRYGFSVDPTMLYPPLAMIVAYIASQAYADTGKEAAKINLQAAQVTAAASAPPPVAATTAPAVAIVPTPPAAGCYSPRPVAGTSRWWSPSVRAQPPASITRPCCAARSPP
jgi:hypothetical protein